MTPSGQLGGILDTFTDLRDFFERSGAPFWLQDCDYQLFDPDVKQEHQVRIHTREDRTITHLFAQGRMPRLPSCK
jgi:hypothetical protein